VEAKKFTAIVGVQLLLNIDRWYRNIGQILGTEFDMTRKNLIWKGTPFVCTLSDLMEPIVQNVSVTLEGYRKTASLFLLFCGKATLKVKGILNSDSVRFVRSLIHASMPSLVKTCEREMIKMIPNET